uniref:Uncharacterized protein n=1 Tax=Glossina morsitans morsitans TaxID=37546 RepID=A0A1B0GC65_GLOMM
MKSICIEILAILLANSCIERKGPDNSSVHFMVSADFSSHTKHESNATVCGVVKSLKTPLNIISVTNSSSAELSSQATRPLNSITSAAVQYSMRRKTRLRPRRPARPAICMYSPEDIQRKSLPSNLRGAVNKTVLAGIFRPIAKVSVANKALSKPSPNKISIISFSIDMSLLGQSKTG